MGSKDPHRFAALYQQSFVVLQAPESVHDGVVALPVSGGLAPAPIDDEFFRRLRHVGVQIVHQHSQGGFLVPALAGKGRSNRSPDGLRRGAGGGHDDSKDGAGVSRNLSRR